MKWHEFLSQINAEYKSMGEDADTEVKVYDAATGVEFKIDQIYNSRMDDAKDDAVVCIDIEKA